MLFKQMTSWHKASVIHHNNTAGKKHRCDNHHGNFSRIKVTPGLHLTYSENGGNLGLVLKIKNVACISILLTKHVKYTYLYLFKFVLYNVIAFKAN